MAMKKLTCLLILVLSLSAFAGGEKLIGTWKSNKAGTLAYLKTHTHLTGQQLDVVGLALGKMSFVFDKTNMVMQTDDWKQVRPYKFVSKTANSVTIESKDPKTQKTEQSVFEFYGDHFWVPDDRIPGYKERFDKVVSK
jgi:hypothetical protein